MEDLRAQKVTLRMCFRCLEGSKQNKVDIGLFKRMMDIAFGNRLSEDNINKVFKSVAGDERYISIEKFETLANTMQSQRYLFDKEPLEIKVWEK